MNSIFYAREVLTAESSQTICPGQPVSPANDMALQSFCPFCTSISFFSNMLPHLLMLIRPIDGHFYL